MEDQKEYEIQGQTITIGRLPFNRLVPLIKLIAREYEEFDLDFEKTSVAETVEYVYERGILAEVMKIICGGRAEKIDWQSDEIPAETVLEVANDFLLFNAGILKQFSRLLGTFTGQAGLDSLMNFAQNNPSGESSN